MTMDVRPPDPPLSDGVVTLRLWGLEGDVEAIVAACNDPAIAEFLEAIPSPYVEDDARAYIDLTRQGWADGTRTNFAVVVDGAPVGSVSVQWLEPDQGMAEVGYWVSPEVRGQGVCTRAVRLISRWVLERPGMERLQLRADEENAASRKVAEKAGFTQEGILRSSRYNPRLGRRINFVMFSLLRHELEV